MTSDEVFIEVLDRLGSMRGSAVLISICEFKHWPVNVVTAMKSQGLLSKTRPAKSAVCPGCERECVMPVHFISNAAGLTQALIVCDQRGDVSRVPVGLEFLEQWQASGDTLADMLAQLLSLRRSGAAGLESSRWEIGLFKGAKHNSHLALFADGGMLLSLAGHRIPLVEVLTFDGKAFKVDKRKLTRIADQPALGGGDVESADQRRERLKKRMQELKKKGVKAFQKTLAHEEGISISRLKQLLNEDNEPKKSKSPW